MSFEDMIAALFADSMLARAAIYQPKDASESFTVRVMAKRPDVITGFGEGNIHSATCLFDVQAKDVVRPTVGDRITVDDAAYIVQSEPVADSERLVWTLNARPA